MATALSPAAQQAKVAYAALSFWELHKVQQVHVADYNAAKAEGDTERDGTIRAAA